ncbi:MAG: hypothetical protein NTZ19_10845 [Bacteroidetes bacterium]|nr:hypothetical protein [Bacteroidota bacterium]
MNHQFLKLLKSFILFFLFTFLLQSCSPIVDYLGKSYAPTNNVDMAFNRNDVKYPFEEMGMMQGKGGKYSDIQNKMLEEARKRGADAIVFENHQEVVTGSNTNTNANWNSQTNSAATNTNKPVTTQKTNTYGSGYANTTSTNTSVKVVQAVLLKYKRN